MSAKSERSLSEAVIGGIAHYKGVDEVALEKPLYDAIDPEALNTLFREGAGEVTFCYLDLVVTVTSEREIDIRSANQCRTPTVVG